MNCINFLPMRQISLSHGSGGKLMHDLINNLFVKYFDNTILSTQTDSAVLEKYNKNIVFTTDSYVVDPIFFPGGNIGKLAICGTVNDLSVSGAIPLYISCGFIIEEGFSYDDLETIVKSMSEEAKNAQVKIVTGDTKVVNKGKCDKIFINTSGIGLLDEKFKKISYGTEIKVGDKIIINGYIADHGIAIMCARNPQYFKSKIKSDCACLNMLIQKVLNVSDNIKFIRDATRGGVATILCELAEKRGVGIEIQESVLPIRESVKGMCEIFGFDPLYIANEGKFVMIVGKEDANKILSVLKKDKLGVNSAIIGEITNKYKGKAILNTEIGGKRIIDMLTGEQLPRIC